MNPTNPEQAGFKLPAPEAQPPAEQTAEQGFDSMPETAPSRAENNPSLSQATSAAALPTLPLDQTGQDHTATNSAVSTTSDDDVLATAKVSDLIEKEWVEKAKQIINSNREDPYKQSKQINIVRSEYMKKNYNKTIKLSE